VNRADVAELMVFIASFDGRDMGEAEVDAWLAVVGDWPLDLGRQAVADHYRHERTRIMPSELITRVRALRDRQRPDEFEVGGDTGKCPFRECQCTHTAPCDRGWIENSNGTVRPCPTCRPEQARIVADSRGRPPGKGRLRKLRDRSWRTKEMA
jgi:MoaA/NifB/PqqE/SkfB family radical SAM enzyme